MRLYIADKFRLCFSGDIPRSEHGSTVLPRCEIEPNRITSSTWMLLRVSTLVRGIPFTLPARATACRRRLTIRGEARRARVVAIFLQFVSVFFLPRRKSSRLDSPDVSTPARDIDPWRFSLRNSRINNDTSWGGEGLSRTVLSCRANLR